MNDAEKAGKHFEVLVRILDTLRGEKGCPWDKEQDEKSIANYFLEEAYETLEALMSGSAEALSEELGDVLMEVVFLARIFKEKKIFTISDVVEGINQKMVHRHPHVFGKKRVSSPAKVKEEWNDLKEGEKEGGVLSQGLPKHSPSLFTAYKIGLRAADYGFDWSSPDEVLKKVKEEIAELEKAIPSNEGREMMQEMGDIFFSLASLARHLGLNPEISLRMANEKFVRRFQHVEKIIKKRGRKLKDTTLYEMDEIWEEAKLKKR